VLAAGSSGFVGAHPVRTFDVSSPGACFLVAGFDKPLEVLHILCDSVGEYSGLSATFSTMPSGRCLFMVGSCIRFPGDTFVGMLFGNGGIEFSYFPGYLEDPMGVNIVGLSNFLYSVSRGNEPSSWFGRPPHVAIWRISG